MTSYSDLELHAELTQELAHAGYTLVPSPFHIGDIRLDFDAVFEAPGNQLDLAIVLAPVKNTEDEYRMYWRVQRLARALDAVGSRRTITALAISGIENHMLASDLQTVARVLVVDRSLPLRRLIAPMLRLHVPELGSGSFDGMKLARSSIKGQYADDLRKLLNSAQTGSEAVATQYQDWVDLSFEKRKRRTVR